MDENFRYKTNYYTLHFVLRQIESGRMEVNPAFKDIKPQSTIQKSRFIESLILGIPTQPIWCEESPSGDYIVLEGSERLLTLVDFVNGEFRLTGLKIRKEYSDFNISDLPYHARLLLEERYSFTFIIINYDTSAQLKCEFFRRLLYDLGNKNAQSARNFAWGRSFKFLQDLKESCKNIIEFAPSPTFRLLRSNTMKVSSQVDAVYLNLLMISLILSGDIFEAAYLDKSISIEDLLDWTMGYFEEENKRHFEAENHVFYVLSKIADYLGRPPRVLLQDTRRTRYRDDDYMSLPEFYFVFVRASADKLNKSMHLNEGNAPFLLKSQSARTAISDIFRARND